MDILCWKGWGLEERGRCDRKGSSVPRLSHHGQPILWQGDTSLVLIKLTLPSNVRLVILCWLVWDTLQVILCLGWCWLLPCVRLGSRSMTN